MIRLTGVCLCFILVRATSEPNPSTCSGNCKSTDQLELLQRHVGVAEATMLGEGSEALGMGESVARISAQAQQEGGARRDSEIGAPVEGNGDDPRHDDGHLNDADGENGLSLAGRTFSEDARVDDFHGEGGDPSDTDADCSGFKSNSDCRANGCAWTAVFDGEEKDDGSGQVHGYLCADDEEVKEEERDFGNVSSQIQAQADQLDVTSTERWCRRRRVHRRRRRCRWARRRRAPPAPPLPAVKYTAPGVCDESLSGKGSNYRGCQDKTRSGKTCQKWTSQTPHRHFNTPARRPRGGLGDFKYCRNPNGMSSIWCYTTSSKRWEYCNAAPVKSAPPQVNLKGKVATQSSTSHGARASRAIDGNANTQWGSRSCTHTYTSNNPWWQVDLGSSQSISGIKITNRGDCCGNRLNGFTVRIDGTPCAKNVGIAQGETKVVICSGTGQKIRVQTSQRNPLTICEVAVFLKPQTTTVAPPTTQAPPKAPETSQKTPAISSIFKRADIDDNGILSRDELKKAFESGVVHQGKTLPVPSPKPDAPAPSTDSRVTLPSKAQQDAIVRKHNELRAGMGASDMTKMVWDDTLASAAQRWASGCPRGHSDNRDNVGENMAWKWSSGFKLTASTDFTPSVQSWYDEIGDAGSYKNGGKFSGFGSCTGVCGHYTQVVWAAANKIGCGAAYCPHKSGMGGYELVCQYGSSVPGGYGGNMQSATLFTKAAACSKCPEGFKKCSSSLCAP